MGRDFRRELVGRFPHPDVAHDVFDFDDRIVDEDAGAEGDRSRLTKLSEKPRIRIAQNAGKIDSGSDTAAMTVMRRSRRKRKTTITARRAPSNSV